MLSAIPLRMINDSIPGKWFYYGALTILTTIIATVFITIGRRYSYERLIKIEKRYSHKVSDRSAKTWYRLFTISVPVSGIIVALILRG